MAGELTTLGLARGTGIVDGGGVAAKMRAVTSRTYVVDAEGGTSNKYVRTTNQHPFGFRFTGRLYAYWPNWFVKPVGAILGGGVETGSGGPLQLQSKFSYYDAVTGAFTTKFFKQFSDDNSTLSCVDGADCVGYVDVDVKAGSHAYEEIAAFFGNQMVFSQNLADRANGDVFQFGSGWLNGSTDLASMLATTPSNSAFVTDAWYGAYRLIGLSTVKAGSIIGDSRQRYLDTPNTPYGCIGAWDRMLGPYMPTTNMSRPGETAADFAVPSNNPKRIAALKADGDFLFNGLVINDLYFQGRTAAQVDADNTAIETNIGLPAFRMTADPVINYPANTVSNSAAEARRKTYNDTYVRTKAHYYDPAASNEAGSTGTYVSTTLVNPDGTHENSAGHANPINNASAIDLRSFLGLGSPYTFENWDFNNLDASIVQQWLHPADYTVGLWTARIGPNAVQGTPANQPAVGGSGGANVDSTHWLTSALSSSVDTEYLAVTAQFTAVTGNQTMLGSTGNGRQFRTTGNTVLTNNKQGTGQRGATTVSPAISAGVLNVIDAAQDTVAQNILSLNGKIYADGTNVGNPYNAGLTSTYGRAGVTASEVMTGTIFEVLSLNSVPPLAIRQKVEARLAWRAGVQASLDASNPYVSSQPTL